MQHGWIILDKAHGLGSTQAVGAVKRIWREAGLPKPKIGHGGTLDPLATGVLPIALGEATKLAGRMLDASKVYDFTIGFGAETDTLDLEGEVVAQSDVLPTLGEIEAVLPHFTGAIDQVPPAYSALKVGGERAYDLARAGEVVELASRNVTVYAMDITHPNPSLGREGLFGLKPLPSKGGVGVGASDSESLPEITLTAHVSKGTYIRSLARDIARALGTNGHVIMLRRTKAGPFTLEQAISLDFLAKAAKEASLKDIILPLGTALVDIPALALSPEQARLVKYGQVLTGMAATDGLHLAQLDEIPVALVNIASGTMTVERGFNL